MTDNIYNPWAGLASYEDPATAERKLKFCGRDDDSYDLARLIMGNVFVTLYGKSGIGKTSLLNAGVFPELREEQYSPDSLRLGIRDEEHPLSYQTMIINAVERVVTRTETVNVIAEQKDQQSIDFLWNYFARHRFYDKNDEPTTPVFVFDQFEEVFRGHRDEAEILLKQLDYINDKDHTLDRCEIDGQTYRYEQNFRFVVSIREDDLYLLEDSIDNCYLPALKRCRYRLRSLSEDGAKDAILIPGKGLFNSDEKDSIANAIISKSRNDDGSISTNIVSLLCSRIYVDFKKSGADHISPLLVDNFLKGNPFEQFYNEATKGFFDREKSYIEDNFVDSTGRRNSIPESDFLRHVPNGTALLEGDTRILQRTSTSSDGKHNRVELIHDSFCEPLLKLKEKRIRRKRILFLATVLGIAALCIGVACYILYQSQRISHQNSTIAQQQSTIAQYNADLLHERDSLRRMNNELHVILNDLEESREQTNNAKKHLEIKNLQMAEINSKLQMKNRQMDSTNHVLYQQKQILLTNESRILAEKANALVDNGDSYLARLLALEALPPNRPYTIEAEIALRKAILRDHNILRGHTDRVTSAAFSPDGKYIVSASWDTTVRIWDAKTGQQVHSLLGHNNKVNSVAFSPDGMFIVSASNDVRIWDAKTGQQVGNPLEGHSFAGFSPDGKYIVSASNDETVRIWDTETRQQVGSPLEGHSFAAFSPDGKLIVSASGYTIRIWDIETRQQVHSLLGHTDYVTSAAFSPDGKYIVSASNDETVRIWDTETGQQVDSLLGHSLYVNSAVFSPDGEYIVSASWDKTVRIWDTKTGQRGVAPLRHTNVVYSATFSPDGRYIMSASGDNTIRIWDAETWQREIVLRYTNEVMTAAYSPDGRYIVFASKDTTVRIWDTETEQQVGDTLEGHFFAVFSPDGKYIVAASNDTTVRIWDTKTRQEVHTLLGHTDYVNSAAFSPDGKYIVSASKDNTVRIWDANTGQQVGSPLEGHTFAAFSPDGKYIVAASHDNIVRIWDTKTRRLVHSLLGHTDHVSSAAFSPDGRNIVSASYDKTVRIWDAKTGQQVHRLLGHTDWVYSVAFSPDGRYIVSASALGDRTVRIWDTKTGQQVHSLLGHTYDVTSATFSPDGRHIVSASADKTIRIWDFSPLQELIESTKERFKDRPLTQEEKRKYYLE